MYLMRATFLIDIVQPLRDNPALFIGERGMVRSPSLNILLLSSDVDLQAQLKHELREANLTMSKDWDSLPRTATKRPFDLVLVEARRGFDSLAGLHRTVDPAGTVVLSGNRAVLRQAGHFAQTIHWNGRPATASGDNLGLEDYIQSKLSDFVKGMKSSAARNLHPMLISAVERPLIALALKETNGNQIQAARLLGMNRNTLRKKITELRIPIKREKTRTS
jgi:DNA-binding protein Fis